MADIQVFSVPVSSMNRSVWGGAQAHVGGPWGGSAIAYGALGQLELDKGCDSCLQIIRGWHLNSKFLMGASFIFCASLLFY
jgi:hypothetical protein